MTKLADAKNLVSRRRLGEFQSNLAVGLSMPMPMYLRSDHQEPSFHHAWSINPGSYSLQIVL